jgi:hypothetical protein
MKIRIALFAIVLMLSSLACSFASQLLEEEAPVETVPAVEEEPVQPEPSQPEPAQPEPTESPSQTGSTLFEDDFSDTSSGWDRDQDEDGMSDYDNGVYRIKIDVPDLVIWANPELGAKLPSDVRIEVEATNTGIDNNSMGIICRYSWDDDQPSFYRFLISSDGYAGIVLVSEGSQNVISDEGKLLPYDGINQGAATNHITVECIGDQLKLFANDIEIVSATDSTLTSGDVGLSASTYDETGTDILFDNFIVTRP